MTKNALRSAFELFSSIALCALLQFGDDIGQGIALSIVWVLIVMGFLFFAATLIKDPDPRVGYVFATHVSDGLVFLSLAASGFVVTAVFWMMSVILTNAAYRIPKRASDKGAA